MVMSDDVEAVPVLIEAPHDAGHHGLEYVNKRIDVSDVDEIVLKKDHNVMTITEDD